MGEEQRPPRRSSSRCPRAAFEGGTDFTVAVEEEFALLIRRPAAARRQPLRGHAGCRLRGATSSLHLVGELIASEAEVRTGKCADFHAGGGDDGRAPRGCSCRRLLHDSSGLKFRQRPARIRGRAGRTSGSSTRRTTAEMTSLTATSSGAITLASTHASASAAPTARSPCTMRCAASCRSCSRSRPARRSSRASTAACIPRARRSSRARSRAAGSRTPTTAGRASRSTSGCSPLARAFITGAHAALVERPAAPRVPDGRDPDLRRPARPRRVPEDFGADATRLRPAAPGGSGRGRAAS